MTVALKTAPATTSHIMPTQLVSGTFVTTDLKRARRMCEELLGLECVEAEPGTLLIREQGHQPGGPLAGTPYWVLEAREVPTIETPQAMPNPWGVFVSSQAAGAAVCVPDSEAKEQGPQNRFKLSVPRAADVDAAHAAALEQQSTYGIRKIGRVEEKAGIRSFTLQDLNKHWWEITNVSQSYYDEIFAKGR